MGRRYQDRARVRRVLEHRHVSRIVARLSRNLTLLALAFRFIPGLRTAGPLSLAAAGMKTVPYAALTAISALVWGVASVALGYLLGQAVVLLLGDLHRIEHALIAPALVGVALVAARILWRRHRRKRDETERAE
ncbi:VTT domain-containing protein [Roseibacterium sp. SDUM158017]|uniref:DedA family protein n=1 Tax=Roseicyclus salinarum TaxID=3036773 RepID=UPI00241515B6|nr:VTT domain-containing protein [Roseibacterium sp. SDUM158017]MDG4647409.1 VTT domain-containing protein [Roseibacterium sp. SDUM158017]